MSTVLPYELPVPVTNSSADQERRIRTVIGRIQTASDRGDTPEVAAYSAIKEILSPNAQIGAQRAALRDGASLLLRDAAAAEIRLGPVAVALTVGAMETARSCSLDAWEAGQAAIYGILSATTKTNVQAELIVRASLRSAAAIPPDLLNQPLHDFHSIRLR